MANSQYGPQGIVDFRLRDSSGAATVVDLVLDVDEQENPRWRELRIPPNPPRQSVGAFSYTHKDPIADFIFAQDDWAGGALRPYYRQGDARYGEADGVDARWEGVLALGMKVSPFLNIIGDGTFEVGLGAWVNTQGYGAVVTTAPRTGSKHLVLKYQTPSEGGVTLTISNTAGWEGQTLYIGGYMRNQTIGTNRNLKVVFYKNSVDGANVLNSSGGGATTDSYAWFTHNSGAVPASTTSLIVELKSDSGAVSNGVNVDDLVFWVSANDTNVGVVEAAGKLYTAVGPLILRWDETNDYWAAVNCHTTATAKATSIVSYKDVVYVGYGSTGGYVHGNDTTWTVESDAGTLDQAYFFCVQGDELWKSETTTTIKKSLDNKNPVTDQDWEVLPQSTVTEAGNPLTGLYALNGGIVAAAERGLYVKQSNELLFTNAAPVFQSDPSSSNFDRGVVRGGWLYLTTAKQGLVRFNGYQLEDLSELFIAPRLTNYGGRVRAITQDPHQLYLLVDIPTVDTSTSKTTRLMSLRQLGARWVLHTLQNIEIGNIDTLQVAGTYLYAFGRLQHTGAAAYVMAGYRWKLPEKSTAPYADDITVRELEVSGTVEISIWHGDTPGEVKALMSGDFWVEDTDSSNTIAVKFGADGAASSANTLGTISTVTTTTPAVVSLDASSLAKTGRFWNFQLTFTRDSTQAAGAHESPKLYAFALHFVLVPTRIRAWEVWTRLDAPLRTSMPNPVGVATLLSNLDTLETQAYPIQLVQDFDQDDSETTVDVRIVQLERIMPEEEKERSKQGRLRASPGFLYHIVLQEV
ncbi:MAG TPA: hypothetical protein ACFYED_00125 [Candidatus Tripitaka californicus]|uniref:hypothetical protein n=1 Tax=Candidatus Tripitaka californicus TaxID=3367616 RepID=UPI00402A5554